MKASKKINLVFVCGLLFASALMLQACGGASSEQAASSQTQGRQPAAAPARAEQLAPQTAHGAPGRVPRFAATAADLKNLPPVLPASQFTGMTRMAYAAVKEIPETIAQLPCYCHCDEGFGHKSLQTCFVDDHASHCAVCVEEALLAYKLQKEERLNPAQIRERIIAKYGQEQ
jgi:hypothetical protein